LTLTVAFTFTTGQQYRAASLPITDRVTTGPENVGMISFAWEEFVQNTVRTVQYVRKKVLIGVSSQLIQRGVVGCVQAEPDSTSYGCFETLLVSHAGETPPCR